jgi:hypothetical protein
MLLAVCLLSCILYSYSIVVFSIIPLLIGSGEMQGIFHLCVPPPGCLLILLYRLRCLPQFCFYPKHTLNCKSLSDVKCRHTHSEPRLTAWGIWISRVLWKHSLREKLKSAYCLEPKKALLNTELEASEYEISFFWSDVGVFLSIHLYCRVSLSLISTSP